jgi:hypothetical protein
LADVLNDDEYAWFFSVIVEPIVSSSDVARVFRDLLPELHRLSETEFLVEHFRIAIAFHLSALYI